MRLHPATTRQDLILRLCNQSSLVRTTRRISTKAVISTARTTAAANAATEEEAPAVEIEIEIEIEIVGRTDSEIRGGAGAGAAEAGSPPAAVVAEADSGKALPRVLKSGDKYVVFFCLLLKK